VNNLYGYAGKILRVDLTKSKTTTELLEKELAFSTRFMSESMKKGASKGEVVRKEEFERMLDEYYKIRGAR
jgi:aldehyde:ferredoxin oxidoreductase